MAKPTIPVSPHKRSKPSPVKDSNPSYPKSGPKTVPVKPHRTAKPK